MESKFKVIVTMVIGFVLLIGVFLVEPLTQVFATSVSAGFDLFETDSSVTQWVLQTPADFFAPGSAPFSGVIFFEGVPLPGLGTTDTIVERKQDATFSPPDFTDTIPIELVALSLHSVQPITVNVRNSVQLWDVSVGVSCSQPSDGLMKITHEIPNGGTFSSVLYVRPCFTFTRQSDSNVIVVDAGALGLPSVKFCAGPDSDDLNPACAAFQPLPAVPWRHESASPPEVLRVLTPTPASNICAGTPCEVFEVVTGDFFASVTEEGKVLTEEEAQLAKHGVRPAQPRHPPCEPTPLEPSSGCDGIDNDCDGEIDEVDEDITPPLLTCELIPGQNPARKGPPDDSAGFWFVQVSAEDDCGISTVFCDIDGIPVEDGELVKITVAPGLKEAKVTEMKGVKHIVGPTGVLMCEGSDLSGNLTLCRTVGITPPPLDGETSAAGDEDGDGLNTEITTDVVKDTITIHARLPAGATNVTVTYEIHSGGEVHKSGSLTVCKPHKVVMGSSGTWRVVVEASWTDANGTHSTQDVVDVVT